tara:strand:+ start:69 stop:329 length:261 start_codon:yes stop_codon:yes gene_type:complete
MVPFRYRHEIHARHKEHQEERRKAGHARGQLDVSKAQQKRELDEAAQIARITKRSGREAMAEREVCNLKTSIRLLFDHFHSCDWLL